MSKPTLEGKIGTTLHKANRLKATHAKLERVDELLDSIRSLLEPLAALPESALNAHQQAEKQRLEGYRDLCVLHKIKFQIDAVLRQVKAEIHRLSQDPQLRTRDRIEALIYRLRAVMTLDADHVEARELFRQLAETYPHYVQDAAQSAVEAGRWISIAPHQAPDMRIVITCQKAVLEKHETLRAKAPLYAIPETARSDDNAEYRLRFSLKDLDDLELFHEELRTHPNYRIRINDRPLQEQHFTDWLHCYMRFRKAGTPNYCYGASPFTFNVFGCHKLYMPDLAKRLDLCWFSHGSLDPESGFFFLESAPLLQHLNHQLTYCGFCPALTQEKLSIGSNVLPYVLNPECDDRWQYWPPHNAAQHVIPTGQSMVIASSEVDFAHVAPSQLIEVAPTPYIDKLLRYLESGDLRHLGAQTYRGLSTCIHCGGPYKPHTMICGKCRVDFWKYALQDLEHVLARIHSHAPILLPSPVQEPSPPVSRVSRAAMPPDHADEESISFEQLWNDPQVRQMLTTDTPVEPSAGIDAHSAPMPGIDAHADVSSDLKSGARESLRMIAEQTVPQPDIPAPPEPEESLHLHEKIRRLMSKKYRERKAIENAFSNGTPVSTGTQVSASSGATPGPSGATPTSDAVAPASSGTQTPSPTPAQQLRQREPRDRQPANAIAATDHTDLGETAPESAALLNAIKSLKTRQKSELSKRGVVRVVYLATMDKDTCPLCAYLDGMVMDPDDPATDIFSPPLYPGCTCRREYVLKTEKPQNWPRVTFKFPPKDLLAYLDK